MLQRLGEQLLDRSLKQLGMTQIVTDPGLYAQYDQSAQGARLMLILSCHVDDIKACGEESDYQRLKSHLEKAFGALTELSLTASPRQSLMPVCWGPTSLS